MHLSGKQPGKKKIKCSFFLFVFFFSLFLLSGFGFPRGFDCMSSNCDQIPEIASTIDVRSMLLHENDISPHQD